MNKVCKNINLKVAVITPYYKEDDELLKRCINSVQSQTISCDHFLVSDGFPKQWIDHESVRHLKLGKSHSDYGNTPRGLGGQLAISEDYDAICFLDADNWFDDDHVESCFDSVMSKYDDWMSCDYVIAKRRFCRPDLSIMNIREERNHIDTNCYLFLRGSHFLIPTWNMIPVEFSSVGDRIFYKKIISHKLISVESPKETVNYLSLWANHYLALGETPPVDAKKNVSSMNAMKVFGELNEKARLFKQRNLGMRI